jgi:hypothetical protein
MKKFLSLVLALVMTMSLVVVGASAKDFTDSSAINYKEAVDVVSACKIIDGYTDGSFNPTATLTRGAAAKIICNMILGPTTAAALGADAAPFKDVPANHTFAGYIAYCAQQGIINGFADGTFRPAATVTGYQFMKMLLGALGYDGKIEGFTGDNWSVNVAKIALNISLDDGNDNFVGSKALTREEACLYAFNTIKANMVEYDSTTNITVGGTNITVGGSKAKNLTFTNAGINDKYDGQISKTKDNIVQFGEKYFQDLKLVVGTSTDSFGRPATEWKYKSDSVGTYGNSDNLLQSYTAAVSKGDLYTLVGKTAYDDLGNATETAAKLTVWVDGAKVVDGLKTAAAIADYMVKSSTADAANTGNGVLTEVYLDNDTNAVTIVVINTFLVQASSDYSSSKENVAVSFVDNGATNPGMPTTISQDDFNVSGVKEDDYLLVTYSKDTKEIKSVTPAKMVTGEVSTYTTSSNVTIDGTKYKYNKLVGKTADEKAAAYEIGENAAVVLDTYGYIIHVDDVTVASDNYVYIRAAAKDGVLSSATVKADAYFLDGSNKEITLYKVDDVKGKDMASKAADDVKGWYTYTATSDNQYTLKTADVATYVTEKAITYTSAQKVTVNGKISFLYSNNSTTNPSAPVAASVKGDSNTIFVVRDSKDDVTVYTGVAKVPTVTAAGGSVIVSYVAKSGYAKYVFIDAKAASGSGAITDDTAVTDQYTLVLKTSGNKVNVSSDNYYYTYTALVNGELQKDLKMEESNSLVAGKLYSKIKTTSDGYATASSTMVTDAFNAASYNAAMTLTNATVSQSNGTVTFNQSSSLALLLSSDAKIYLVLGPNTSSTTDAALNDSGADYETYTVSAKSLVSMLSDYAITGTVYGVKTDNKSDCETVKALYVYVGSTSNLFAVAAPMFAAKVAGYTATVDVDKAIAGATVTVTVSNDATGAAKTAAVVVKDSTGATISVSANQTFTGSTAEAKTFTFTMPANDIASITVTLS